MAEEKKPKTPTQKKKTYKRISRACFVGQFLSVAAPFVTIGIVNYDKYFVEYNGTKMSIAAIMSAAVMGLAIWLVAKKKFTNSYVTLLIGWVVIDANFFLLGQIINDIAYIMLFGFIGLLGAFGLDIASAKLDEAANKIQKGIDSAEEQLTREAYIEEKQESEKKKIKVKVKTNKENTEE